MKKFDLFSKINTPSDFYSSTFSIIGITEFLATNITAFIQQTGYITVFLGMIMESMIFPVPSEAIMPFAGFLVATKHFSLRGVIVVSTLGSVVGSLLSYAIGSYGGKPFIRKFGKYFLLDEEELESTEHFFKKNEASGFLSVDLSLLGGI